MLKHKLLHGHTDRRGRPKPTVWSICTKHIKESLGLDAQSERIIAPAMYIAANAIATCTCNIISGRRYLRPPNREILDRAEDLYLKVVADGLYVKYFRKAAFWHALPGLVNEEDTDLLVSSNGYVLSLSVLWNISTRERDSLSIRLCQGDIKREDLLLERVREGPIAKVEDGESNDGSEESEQSEQSEQSESIETEAAVGKVIVRNEGSVDVPKYAFELPSQHFDIKFTTTHSASSTTLDVKTQMTQADETASTDANRAASWIACMSVLAVAKHLEHAPHLLQTEEQLLSTQAAKRAKANPVLCFSLFGGPKVSIGPRRVVLTDGDERYRFFASASCAIGMSIGIFGRLAYLFDMEHRCCIVLPRQSRREQRGL